MVDSFPGVRKKSREPHVETPNENRITYANYATKTKQQMKGEPRYNIYILFLKKLANMLHRMSHYNYSRFKKTIQIKIVTFNFEFFPVILFFRID